MVSTNISVLRDIKTMHQCSISFVFADRLRKILEIRDWLIQLESLRPDELYIGQASYLVNKADSFDRNWCINAMDIYYILWIENKNLDVFTPQLTCRSNSSKN